MDELRKRWYQVPLPIRKPVIFVLGILVVATGAVLLVLPGPGWAIIFVGLAILATEYEFARKLKHFAVAKVKHGIAKVTQTIQKK